jgi:hypothetical protein
VYQRSRTTTKLSEFYFKPPRPSHMLLYRFVLAPFQVSISKLRLNRGEYLKEIEMCKYCPMTSEMSISSTEEL